MPSATIDSHGVSGVAAAGAFLDNLLARAEIVKQTASIEPPLEKSDFDDVRRQLSDALNYEFVADEPVDAKRLQRFAVIETAARDTFKSLIVSWSQNRVFPPPFGV
jgi:THO complex subunit 1